MHFTSQYSSIESNTRVLKSQRAIKFLNSSVYSGIASIYSSIGHPERIQIFQFESILKYRKLYSSIGLTESSLTFTTIVYSSIGFAYSSIGLLQRFSTLHLFCIPKYRNEYSSIEGF